MGPRSDEGVDFHSGGICCNLLANANVILAETPEYITKSTL